MRPPKIRRHSRVSSPVVLVQFVPGIARLADGQDNNAGHHDQQGEEEKGLHFSPGVPSNFFSRLSQHSM